MTIRPKNAAAATGMAPVSRAAAVPGAGPPAPAVAEAPGKTPGGVGGTAAAPSGARTWTLTLPAGLKVLNLNDTFHWSEVYRRRQALKKAAWAMALQAKIPRLGHALVELEYLPPDLHKRDGDNMSATAKPCIDGITAAGVFEDDSSDHVTYKGCRIGSLWPKGRVVVFITDTSAPAFDCIPGGFHGGEGAAK